jgi:hypothetical protein
MSASPRPRLLPSSRLRPTTASTAATPKKGPMGCLALTRNSAIDAHLLRRRRCGVTSRQHPALVTAPMHRKRIDDQSQWGCLVQTQMHRFRPSLEVPGHTVMTSRQVALHCHPVIPPSAPTCVFRAIGESPLFSRGEYQTFHPGRGISLRYPSSGTKWRI